MQDYTSYNRWRRHSLQQATSQLQRIPEGKKNLQGRHTYGRGNLPVPTSIKATNQHKQLGGESGGVNKIIRARKKVKEECYKVTKKKTQHRMRNQYYSIPLLALNFDLMFWSSNHVHKVGAFPICFQSCMSIELP